MRLYILESKATFILSNIEGYHATKLLEPPFIQRNKQGEGTLTACDGELEIYYTSDGSEPSGMTNKYQGKFEFSNIRNSPVLQTKNFDSTNRRYIKLVSDQEINNKGFMTIAELGVVTASD